MGYYKKFKRSDSMKKAGNVMNVLGGLAGLALIASGAKTLTHIDDPEIIERCMKTYKHLADPVAMASYGHLIIGAISYSFSTWGAYLGMIDN